MLVFVGDTDGFVGDTDGLDDGLLGDVVLAGVAVVVALDGVDGADDAIVGDATADDATADDASVGDSDVAGDVAAAESWLTSADALELRGWELVHPAIIRPTTGTTDHRATFAVIIANRSCSDARSAHAPSGNNRKPDDCWDKTLVHPTTVEIWPVLATCCVREHRPRL